MHILFAAAECAPFIKKGELGDVIGALPKALKKQGVGVSVVLPKFENLSLKYKKEMMYITSIEVPVGWRQQFCNIEKLVENDITYYFIDIEYYFERYGGYGYFEDGERLAFFARAVLEALPYLDEKSDIIHCHDWQTGPISALLKGHYHNHPFYGDLKTVFTIHNLRYKGLFPKSALSELLDLSDLYFHVDGLEYYGNVSFLKAGLAFSDYLTTVSPTYAKEIQTGYYGESLDGFLRKRRDHLRGILNGVDYEVYNPSQDSFLFKTYQTYKGKMDNKRKLQEVLNLPVKEATPIISMVTYLAEQRGIDLVLHIFHEMMSQDVQFVLLGTGESHYEAAFRGLAEQYPDKVSVNTCFDEGFSRQVYAGSDIFLMPSQFEPCGIGQLIALRYGTLPIVRETGGLQDTVIPYNEFTNEGYGFSFTNYNAHDMLHTLKYAIDLYRFEPNKWQEIVNGAMKINFSWEASSKEYLRLYESLIASK